MSKMANIALQLDEEAVEYGLQGYQEALEQGFTYEVAEDGTATLTPPSNGLEMAYKAWLEERDEILENLSHLKNIYTNVKPDEDIIEQAITFIKEQCHD